MKTQITFQNRTKKLQKKLNDDEIILLSLPSSISYFTNFQFLVPEEREAFLLVSKKSASLVHTSFAHLVRYPHLVYLSGSYPNQLANYLKKVTEVESISKILIDRETLFVAELDAIKKVLDTSRSAKKMEASIKIEDQDIKLIQDLTVIKEKGEIDLIREACAVTAQVMGDVYKKLRSGITEKEVEKIIKKLLQNHNISQLAFPTIVAFGPNSALPHHQPGDEKLEENMPVLIDMGAKVSGYCADMSRTFWFGNTPGKKFLEIEKIVNEAYKKALAVLVNRLEKPKKNKLKESGLKTATTTDPIKLLARDIDSAARTHITNKGYSEKFIHTTGHGLGLSIHEQPSLSWKNTAEIKPKMVITIEPGIYLEGEFGYRYENTVLVTEDGAEVLTKI